MFCDKYKQRLSPSEGKESLVPVQLKGREFRETAPRRHQKKQITLITICERPASLSEFYHTIARAPGFP